jgi:multicomponent Na+:H+ antiporter subunit G
MISTLMDILAGLAVLIGAFFVLVAAVGIIRMPDVYVRMHAATKTGTLGSGLMLVGVALQSGEADVVSRALAAVLFLIITAPVAAHLLGRAAYISGVPTWSGTFLDELHGRYEGGTHRLLSENESASDGGDEAGRPNRTET